MIARKMSTRTNIVEWWDEFCRMNRCKKLAEEPTLSNDRFKKQGLRCIMSNDRFKMSRGVEWSLTKWWSMPSYAYFQFNTKSCDIYSRRAFQKVKSALFLIFAFFNIFENHLALNCKLKQYILAGVTFAILSSFHQVNLELYPLHFPRPLCLNRDSEENG